MTADTLLPYQDPSRSVDERIEDLVARLTLEEKAGLMFHMMIIPSPDLDAVSPTWGFPSTASLLDLGLSHFNIMGGFDTAEELAEYANKIQAAARNTRLGIPVTLSTDPRHAFTDNPQLSLKSGPFSQWPESIGLAAIGDPKRMEEYADIVRQEYLAVGIRMALHPQADLATEPRWSRIAGSLGEDNRLAGELVTAHIRGLQGPAFGPTSVAACVKHFPGGGPLRNGYDSHFRWGTDQIYPGDQWEYHLRPFRAAVAEGTRYMMPAYGKPVGTRFPEVGMAFNKPVLTGCLREELGYDGVVVSDWGILVDYATEEKLGDLSPARAWGVEHLSPQERVVAALDAGVDQFGGHGEPQLILDVVRSGRVPESRIDESVRRILRDKFELGLFESPLVNVDEAGDIVGRKDFVAAGLAAQKDAVTLLKNAERDGKPLLPLAPSAKVHLVGFKQGATDLGVNGAASVDEADVAVVRLQTPWEAKGKGAFCTMFHHGKLDFDQATLDMVSELARKVPVVLDIFADRPPVLGSLDDDASAIMLSFGLSEPALIDVLYGYSPKGKLPFDLPRSMQAVEASRTDTAFDTKEPTYRFGHGLRYSDSL
ncbi:hypothetical protein Q8F55_007305 [Vanrija albida]|uniref:beta-glucosidase n=1 Tax=Vanrija albida TaxID=181172 RepID=A0ABR3PZI4_9TREE